MKIFPLAFCAAALGVWLASTGARADVAPAPAVNRAVENPHLLEVKKRLRPLVSKFAPDAAIELAANKLVVSYRAPAARGAAPDADFIFTVSLASDFVYYRTNESRKIAEGSFRARYNLREIAAGREDAGLLDVSIPLSHWIYPEFYKLVGETALFPAYKSRSAKGDNRGELTRFEFAVAVGRALEKQADQTLETPEQKAAFAMMQQEFAEDLRNIDQPARRSVERARAAFKGMEWQPRAEFLRLEAGFGKGVDKALIASVDGALARYAKEVFTPLPNPVAPPKLIFNPVIIKQ